MESDMTLSNVLLDRTRTQPRPKCAQCGKSYGVRAVRDEKLIYKTGEPKPRYQGNGIVIKEREWTTGKTTGSIEGTKYEENETVLHRSIWDGRTYWLTYEPFCTLRCALSYARNAYRRRLEE